MTDLTTLANEDMPAERGRVPSLPAPELSVDFLARVKEILEVLVGQRGSKWDSAVTFRDLNTTGLLAQGSGQAGAETGGWQAARPQSPIESQVNEIDALIRQTRAYKSLMSRIGSAESYEGLPQEIRAQLETPLADLARARRADLRTIEQKIENERISLASRLQEITASIGRAAAGVRSFSAAYADDLQAMAIRVEQLATQLEGVGTAELEEKLEVIASAVDGLRSQYTLKLQTNPVNGQPPVIAGISLATESPISGPGTSTLIFLADTIAFLTESGSVTPFSVLGDVVYMTNIVMGAGGSLRQGQTAYDTGDGLFLGDIGGVDPALSMRSANGKYIRIRPSTDTFEVSGLRLIDPDISGLQLADRTASIASNPGDSFFPATFAVNSYCGAHTASISNAVNPTYAWSITSDAVQATFSLHSTTNATTVVYVTGRQAIAGDAVSCIITCSISDGGVTKSMSKPIFVEFQ